MAGFPDNVPALIYMNSCYKIPHLFGVAMAASALANCATPKYDASESTFLPEVSRLKPDPDVPFHSSWTSPGLDWGRYDELAVRSVSLQHLRDSEEPEETEDDPRRRAWAGVLAEYAEQEFTDVFQSDKKKRFAVVSSPSENTLIWEMAITEVVPAKPLVNAAATGLSLLGSAVKEIAMNAGGMLAKASTRGVISIEGQLKDGKTGKPVFMFADRERGRPSLVNVKDFQKLGHLKAQIRTWAKQTLAVINKKSGQDIRDPFPIELKFW